MRKIGHSIQRCLALLLASNVWISSPAKADETNATSTGPETSGGVFSIAPPPPPPSPTAVNAPHPLPPAVNTSGNDFSRGGNGNTGPSSTSSVTTTSVFAANADPTHQNESASARAIRLDELGTNQFYGGVTTAAIGIAQLSQTEQDRASSGDNPELKAAREEAINRIATGSHDINTGREVVAHSNAIKASENRLASSGASTGLTAHELAFDRAKASTEANEALDLMEKISGQSADAYIEAVNHGGKDQVISFAAGATNGGMTAAQIAAALPEFATSETAGNPSAPTWSGTALPPMAKSLENAPAGTAKEMLRLLKTNEKRSTASANTARNQHGSGKEETLQPLSADQFFGTIAGNTNGAHDELGDPGDTLFHRIRGQYFKRRAELNMKATSGSAR